MPAPLVVPAMPPFSLLRMRRWLPQFVSEADWTQGMIRDAPRTSLPPGSVYNATDFLLHQPGMAQKRGGTSYAGPAMTGASYAAATVYADFPAGSKLCAIDDRGHLFTVTSGTTTDVSTLGSAFVTVDKPKLKIGSAKNLLVLTANDGTTAPKTYDGTTVANLGGTPPAAIYAAVYKNRLVLANGTATSLYRNRAWFSGSPDIESTWDLTNSWVDFDYAITGMAALQNALLVFSNGQTERLTGSTPPPGTDFDRAAVGRVGCTDARSISVWNDNAIFANPNGVYLSNGASFKDLTLQGGISSYWQGLFSGYSASSWTIATGVYGGNYLWVSVMNGSTLVATLVCNLARVAWWPMTNIKATMFSSATGAASELYYADRSTNRVVALSGVWSPAAGNKNDANGTAVAPLIEFRPLAASPDLTHYGLGELSYDMRDAASDNPTLAVAVAAGIEATSFAAVSESPLAETTDEVRGRFTVAKVAQALTVRLTQTGASSKTEVYLLEVEARPLEAVAGGPPVG